MPAPCRDLRRRLFARYYDRVQTHYEEHLAGRKRELFEGIAGHVLEIGPGTGVNLAYLPREIRWAGVEPNPYMRAELARKARERGVEPEFVEVEGSRISLLDASVDVVLSTLVLCSVPAPAATLNEIRRVLRPGGRFVFVEHVAAPRGTWLRRAQRIARPLWGFMADGCRPDREIDRDIERAGFPALDMERFNVQHDVFSSIVAPHVAGVARV